MFTKIYHHFIAPRIHLAMAKARALCSGRIAFRVLASNMEPTLRSGEVALVQPYKRILEELERGSVIAYRSAKHGGAMVPSRVVALATDTVEVRNGELLVNGNRVAQPYVLPGRSEQEHSRNVGPLLVPEGMAFVLGDFRDISDDSRTNGPLPLSCFLGAVSHAHPLSDGSAKRRVS
jgi:signal peptidase I